jgi:hypothetical protein
MSIILDDVRRESKPKDYLFILLKLQKPLNYSFIFIYYLLLLNILQN